VSTVYPGFHTVHTIGYLQLESWPSYDYRRTKQHMREPQVSDCSGKIQPNFAPHTSDFPLSAKSGLFHVLSEARIRCQGASEGLTIFLPGITC